MLPTNIRLGWKGLNGENTLAYFVQLGLGEADTLEFSSLLIY